MATLLTAILIAMMGVMPALADDSANVPMTVTVLEIEVVSISASPSTISFGTVTQGDAVEATDDPVVVTNLGNVNVTIDVSVGGVNQTFYETYLYTSPDDSTWTVVTDWVKAAHVILTTSTTEDIYLQIDMGTATPTAGLYSATLVIFAEKSV